MDNDLGNILLLLRGPVSDERGIGQRMLRLAQYEATEKEIEKLINEGFIKRYKGTFQVTKKGADATPSRMANTARAQKYITLKRKQRREQLEARKKMSQKTKSSLENRLLETSEPKDIEEETQLAKQEMKVARERRAQQKGRVALKKSSGETSKSAGGVEGLTEEIDRALELELAKAKDPASLQALKTLRGSVSRKGKTPSKKSSKPSSVKEMTSIALAAEDLSDEIRDLLETISNIEVLEREVGPSNISEETKAKKRAVKSLLNKKLNERKKLESELAKSQISLYSFYETRMKEAVNSGNQTPEFRRVLDRARRNLFQISNRMKREGFDSMVGARTDIRKAFRELKKEVENLEKLAAQSNAVKHLQSAVRGAENLIAEIQPKSPGEHLEALKKRIRAIEDEYVRKELLDLANKADRIRREGKPITDKLRVLERRVLAENRDDLYYEQSIWRDYDALVRDSRSQSFKGELSSISKSMVDIQREKQQGKSVTSKLKQLSRRIIELRDRLQIEEGSVIKDPSDVVRRMESDISKLRRSQMPFADKQSRKFMLAKGIDWYEKMWRAEMNAATSMNVKRVYARALDRLKNVKSNLVSA